MSYPKLIHEYLDGQLNMVQEDVLFAQLAKDPDLRVEFNQQVQLQNVAMNDMRTISPSANSTNALFSSLGFSIPSRDYINRITPQPPVTKPVNLGLVRSVGSLFKKHSTTIAAMFVTAGLTTAIFMLTDNRFATVENSNFAQIDNSVPIIVSEGSQDAMESIARDVYSQNKGNSNKSMNAYTSADDLNKSNTSNENQQSNISDLLDIVEVKSRYSSNNSINLAADYSKENKNMTFNAVNDPLSFIELESSALKADGNLKLIVSYSDQNTELHVEQPQEINRLSNFNLTALYKINDKLFVGLSGGNENVAMKFIATRSNEPLEFQLNKALYYGGFVIRSEYPLDQLFEFGDMITPYGQLFAGSTNLGGLLTKGQVGVTLSPYSLFSFNFGYEVGKYYYQADKWNTTSKNGFIFGVGANF